MAIEFRPVLVRVESTGRVHRFVEETDHETGASRLLTDERCQKDQMGAFVEVAEAEASDPDAFCGHCWPRR